MRSSVENRMFNFAYDAYMNSTRRDYGLYVLFWEELNLLNPNAADALNETITAGCGHFD